MYKLSRSTRQHCPNATIISIDQIVQTCHLLPKFGSGDVPHDWLSDSSNVLSLSSDFFFNRYLDLYLFEEFSADHDLAWGPLPCMAFTSPIFILLTLNTDINCSYSLFSSTIWHIWRTWNNWAIIYHVSSCVNSIIKPNLPIRQNYLCCEMLLSIIYNSCQSHSMMFILNSKVN